MAKCFRDDCVNYIINTLLDNVIDNIKNCSICIKNTAIYGYNNEKTHCKECASYNMINKCINCNETAFFISNNKISHCYNCKNENMVSHSFYMCVLCGLQQSVYGYIEGKSVCCSNCAKPDMKNVKNKKCEKCGIKEATWGITKKTHCFLCKNENMIQIKKRRKKICKKCDNIAYYGLINSKDMYCYNHKTEDMIRLTNTDHVCNVCGKKDASLGEKFGDKATHCYDCMIKTNLNLVRVRASPCINYQICFNYKSNNDYYEGYCLLCVRNLFPEKIKINYKTKEYYVMDYMLNSFPQLELIFDKRISNSCSLRRPDSLYDAFTHCILYEVDENQHCGNEEICENKKIMEEFIDLGNRPIVIIRFNTDNYIKENIKYNSPWDKDIGNNLYLKNENEMKERLKNLSNKFKYHIENIPEKEITIEKLYYNDKNYKILNQPFEPRHKEYICEECNFQCNYNSDYIRHLASKNHRKNIENKDSWYKHSKTY